MQRAQKHQNSSVFAFMPAVGTWVVLALALVPLIGMLFAFEHNATLFDAPPLKFSATVPLMGRTLGLAALVSRRSAKPGRRVRVRTLLGACVEHQQREGRRASPAQPHGRAFRGPYTK